MMSDAARPGTVMWQHTLISTLGWNKDLAGRTPTVEDLQFANFFKEIYLDSDTRIALLTNAPSDAPEDWLLPQDKVFEARDRVNREAGAQRMLAHFTLTPGQPGWLDAVDRAIELYRPEG
jgi:hypothetical protein